MSSLASRRWLTRIFSASVRPRPRRSRPEGDPLGEAAVDLLDELDRGGGGDRGVGHGRDPLASSCVRYKYRTSARDPLPRDRRRPPRAGGGRRVRRGAHCCRASRSCRQPTRPAGSRSARRWSCCATRGWSTPARASAGSPPSTRCASRSAGSARSRRQLAASGVHSERRILDFGFVPAPPRCRAGARQRRPCSRCAGSTSPTASRSRGSRCGAPRTSARSCRGPTSSGRRSTSCSTCRSAAPCRRSAPPWSSPATPSCSRCRVGSPVLRCERVTSHAGGAAGAAVRARLPGPPHGVRGRPADGRAQHRAHRAAPRGGDGALAVVPCQVGDSAGGWAADGGVVSVMVVAVEEAVKGAGSAGF